MDVQSRMPVQLVHLKRGRKTPSLTLVSRFEQDRARVDLRVYSKKEVQQRSCYLHLSFNINSPSDRMVVEMTSTFVVKVSTTLTFLRKIER